MTTREGARETAWILATKGPAWKVTTREGVRGWEDGEGMEDGVSSDEDDDEKLDTYGVFNSPAPLYYGAASGQVDELSLADEDDSMGEDDEMRFRAWTWNEIPDGFRVQALVYTYTRCCS
eukprot:g18878.t1